ncbi:hypothetical protein T4A_5378 [Trichinella pseudospiralis]|uniref:Uncharacterized protein n=1 Tax=Trichinella pseudospiralis TaxID=6337 RepID=A0A0V1DUI4_TRIPS|nr:hypothetical protein T4A_5378 [Trichinella pseudospiralis]
MERTKTKSALKTIWKRPLVRIPLLVDLLQFASARLLDTTLELLTPYGVSSEKIEELSQQDVY